jgi:hypothetical protein
MIAATSWASADAEQQTGGRSGGGFWNKGGKQSAYEGLKNAGEGAEVTNRREGQAQRAVRSKWTGVRGGHLGAGRFMRRDGGQELCCNAGERVLHVCGGRGRACEVGQGLRGKEGDEGGQG